MNPAVGKPETLQLLRLVRLVTNKKIVGDLEGSWRPEKPFSQELPYPLPWTQQLSIFNNFQVWFRMSLVVRTTVFFCEYLAILKQHGTFTPLMDDDFPLQCPWLVQGFPSQGAVCYRKSPCLICKESINGLFSIAMLKYHRVILRKFARLKVEEKSKNWIHTSEQSFN